uniref:Transmembrane protein n=1 Tax=Globodera rostochiensis TaxID=31243 RepID=A0A914HJK5_GLORO
MALSNILTQFCRRKRLNSSDGQLHSEWDRRLGQCSLTTIVATLVLALTLHVILPAIFSHYTIGKSKMLLLSPIISLAFTSALIILAAIQLASISRRIGRNAALYQLAHGTFGQALAVAVAWGQLLDQIAMAATVCHALSDHINLLFHNAFCSLRLPSPIWHGHDVVLLDLLAAVVLPFCAALVMMCSVRVLITSTTIFLIATMFTSASTTTVAFLHNMAQLHVFGNSEHPPETASFLSIDELFATFRCWLLAWPCVELLSFLAEECCGPRRALATLMRAASRVQPALALLALLAFFPFIRLDTSVPLDDVATAAVASVVVHQPLLPLPAMFNSIRLFSARYLMNVGSVCSLWAALLCLFLAPTRLMATMAMDKMILPFGHKHLASISEKGGQPRCAVILVAFCCSLMVGIVPQQWLGRLIPLNCVLRMALQALLVYMSHFTPSSSDRFIGGDLRPKYRRVRRVRAVSRAAQQLQSTEWKMCEEAAAVDDEDEEAEEFGEESSSISADESEDEAWLRECREREHLLERIWRLATADTTETEQHQTAHLKSIDTPLLELNNQPHQQPPNCADYQSIQNGPPCCAPRQSSHLPRQHGQHGQHQRHNCFRAPCSATTMTVNGRTVHTVPLPGLHVYESEVPQSWLGAARRVESGTKAAATCDERAACDAARRALLLAFSAAAVCAAAITALRKTSDDDYLPLLPLLALLSSIVTGCSVIVWLCRLRVDYGTNQQQPLEGKWLPIGALFSMFTLMQLLPFFPPIEWALIFGWILIGLFLHALRLARSES